MRFVETPVAGAWVIELEPFEDERGFFARSFCAREFEARGLETRLVQCNLSWNRRKGTLRGMHYQRPPAAEAKLVRCVRGALFDVVLDLRSGSPTEGRHHGVELSAANRRSLYIPPGCAHGFQSLVDDTEILYQMSEFYTPEAGAGVRHDDPRFGIAWPLPVAVISDRDRDWPLVE